MASHDKHFTQSQTHSKCSVSVIIDIIFIEPLGTQYAYKQEKQNMRERENRDEVKGGALSLV